MQEIATELGLSNCWICGGLKSAERWPWKGEGLTPEQLLKWKGLKLSKTTRRPEGWVIDQRIIGTFCISREGKEFTDLVGYTPCINTLTVNSDSKTKVWQPEPPEGYWSHSRDNNCEWIEIIGLCWYKNPGANPFHALIGLREYWDDPAKSNKGWEAPDGIYWRCGKKAYSELPRRWKGSCTLGIIRPFFFTLPKDESKSLGAPLFETLTRQKRELKRELPMAGGNHKWKEEEWPAERIIQYYGPATWADDGSWGYRTPIYLLNRLIRLQAVVEVVSNHTSEALELLAKQHSQMRAFVYQNRLALDYLLAEEGGVCGRYNESECCMEIDDYGETIKGLAAEIKKVAHVPVQKWNSILQASWWDQIFGQGAWWKKLVFFIVCSIAGIIFLPCLIPCFIRLIQSVVQGMQIAALPIDPEKAQGKPTSLSKLMKLEEEKENKNAIKALKNFENKHNLSQEYCGNSLTDWEENECE
ncbi:endogenous retrovirus group 3 member 1 Env polyprotein-like [Cyanistes caeruleus]|uniref:endogenous retrovirus group 3 member 1 Env polyprotein-like n=1 Tax=Cyanistes caeruleus TaxID=156563 RepID=UPI000CDB8299|nr:endogenous retrovirus group 3 member 1 Env polyprotein-like [Cyanistes caeruleus]